MASPNILHMVTPLKHMSPFDANMALDAGYNAVIPYAQVTLEEIRGLVQDAIFSRSPADGPRTGFFIGGKNALLALDMLSAAREAMVPPFSVSVFADPAGSFTTAAAMVACVQKKLVEKTASALGGRNVSVFGGTGVVGFCSAVIAAMEGANVSLAGYDGNARVKQAAADMQARFNVRVQGVDASSDEKRAALLGDAHVVLCAGPAGVRVISSNALGAARQLIVAADVNAVPPSGIDGVNVQDDGVPIRGTAAAGIGPLAIGNVKYQTEAGLFRMMIASDKAIMLDFRDAFQLATSIVNT